MTHPLTDARLAGLGPTRIRRLEEAGFGSLEALVDADVATLAALPGITRAIAEHVVAQARERLAASAPPAGSAPEPTDTADTEPLPPPPPFESDGELAGTKRLARGMKAARRLEQLAESVRRARGHAGEAPDSLVRAKARKQLKKLHEHLEGLVQAVLSDGIGKKGHDELIDRLAPLEASLDDFLSRKPRKSGLKAVHQAAKFTRELLG